MTPAQAQAFERYQRSQVSNALQGNDRRTIYAVPRVGRAPVRSLQEAYALMDRLTQRHERGELDDIEYEGRANTLLAEVKALEKAGNA